MPLMLQLVQYPNTSSLYSTRVLLAGTNCATGATACAVSKLLGYFLDSGSPGRYQLCRRYCSLCSIRMCRVLARLMFNWQTQTTPPTLQLVQSQTGCNAIFDASESTAAVAPQRPPVLEKSKRKITPPDNTGVSTRRCHDVPTTIHANTQLITTRYAINLVLDDQSRH